MGQRETCSAVVTRKEWILQNSSLQMLVARDCHVMESGGHLLVLFGIDLGNPLTHYFHSAMLHQIISRPTNLCAIKLYYIMNQIGFPSRLFGGFFYDRALGRPVTLDIGFGPLKTRVMGPSDEVLEKSRQDEELVDLANPVTLLVVLTSGGIQLVGKAAGVSIPFALFKHMSWLH